jgi:hypothetical protein
MTYVEKQVNGKIILGGLFYKKEIPGDARGSVESPQARADDSAGLICGICGQCSLSIDWRPVGSQATRLHAHATACLPPTLIQASWMS